MTTSVRSIVVVLLLNMLALALLAQQGQVPLPVMAAGEIGICCTAWVLGWVIGKQERAEGQHDENESAERL